MKTTKDHASILTVNDGRVGLSGGHGHDVVLAEWLDRGEGVVTRDVIGDLTEVERHECYTSALCWNGALLSHNFFWGGREMRI